MYLEKILQKQSFVFFLSSVSTQKIQTLNKTNVSETSASWRLIQIVIGCFFVYPDREDDLRQIYSRGFTFELDFRTLMFFVCFLYICWWIINQIKAINDTLLFNFHLRSEKYCVLYWVWSVDGGDNVSISCSPSCVAVTWSHVRILEPNLKRRLAVSRYACVHKGSESRRRWRREEGED